MPRATLKFREWEEVGIWGFLPHDAPAEFEPATGFGVSHDLLEHFPSHMAGTTEDELLALGAIIYVRAENGWWHRHNPFNYNVARNLGSEWDRFFGMDGDDGGKQPRDLRVCTPVHYTLEERLGMVPMVREICQSGYVSIKDRCDDDSDFAAVDEWLGEEAINAVAQWIITGYRFARFRYCKVPQWRVGELFDNMTTAVEEAQKQFEDEVDNGRKLFVRWRVDTAEVVARPEPSEQFWERMERGG